MFSQDWTPVIFNKKKTEPKPVIVNTKNKLDDNKESFEHKKIPKSIADAIKKSRVELNMTQDQLAKKINERTCVVNDIESMKCIYNHVIVNKVLRALGLTLKGIKDMTHNQNSAK